MSSDTQINGKQNRERQPNEMVDSHSTQEALYSAEQWRHQMKILNALIICNCEIRFRWKGLFFSFCKQIWDKSHLFRCSSLRATDNLADDVGAFNAFRVHGASYVYVYCIYSQPKWENWRSATRKPLPKTQNRSIELATMGTLCQQHQQMMIKKNVDETKSIARKRYAYMVCVTLKQCLRNGRSDTRKINMVRISPRKFFDGIHLLDVSPTCFILVRAHFVACSIWKK